MAYNGSGVFNRLYNWVVDRDAGTKILATRMDDEMDGFATGLSNCLTKDGQNASTANQSMGGFRLTNVGAATAANDAARTTQIQNSAFIWGGTAGGTANALTLALTPGLSAYAAGQVFRFIAGASANTGAATVNIDSVGAKAIQKDGAALIAADIRAGKVYDIIYDGTQFQLTDVGQFARPQIGAVAVTTSGTSIDFTGIPSGVKQITLNFFSVSTTGTSEIVIRLGDSGGIEATGYSTCCGLYNTSTTTSINETTGWRLNTGDAGHTWHGSIVFTLISPANFYWAGKGIFALSNANTGCLMSGSKGLSAELDRVRVTTIGGSDTFDGGNINIAYL